MKTKTIILSNPNSSDSGRGILSFYIEDDLLICKLRLYNIKSLDRATKLGIYHQEEVYSANLIERNGCYETSLAGSFDMEKDFYSAIIDTSNNNTVIISGGTYSGYFFENSIFENNNSLPFEKNISPVENDILSENNCRDCTNCKYKEFFYQNQTFTQCKNSIEKCEAEHDIHEAKIPQNLLDSILPQFDYIFEKYPPNNELNNLIENSKFVNIDESGEKFSIGAIFHNDKIKYICYAVQSNYNRPAPIELGEHYQWLPLNPSDPLSDGYYLVFQDANDLKIVEL